MQCTHLIIYLFKETADTGTAVLNLDDIGGGCDGLFICSVSSMCFPRTVAANIRFSVGHIPFVLIYSVCILTCHCPAIKFHATSCKDLVENAGTA